MIDLSKYDIAQGSVTGEEATNLQGVPMLYQVVNLDLASNKAIDSNKEFLDEWRVAIPFTTRQDKQDGVTMEQLLAICIHRVQSYQNKSSGSMYNDQILIHLKQALELSELRAISN